jgi:hypothetical protein
MVSKQPYRVFVKELSFPAEGLRNAGVRVFSASARSEAEGRLNFAEVSPGLRREYACTLEKSRRARPELVDRGRLKKLSKFDLKNASVQQPLFHRAIALSLQRPSPFCHPEYPDFLLGA